MTVIQDIFAGVSSQTTGKYMHGAEELLRLTLIGYLNKGHILIEGPPGTGKTKTARLLSSILAKSFKRIQFTSDLLPADIIGANVFLQDKNEFKFIEGPIFADFILGDEINRAPPRSQSALLEAMEERQVTVEGKTYKLPEDFFVIATQNPQDLEGTFPLPEAQMDRFMMQIKIDHGSVSTDTNILALAMANNLGDSNPETKSIAIDWQRISTEIESTKVETSILDYIARLLNTSRKHPLLEMGASIRGGMALARAARVHARIEGREFVTPDDVKALCIPCLRHRVKLSAEAQVSGMSSVNVLSQILEECPFPE